MKTIYDRLCDAVRKCVPPTCKIEFAPGELGINENVTTHAYATFLADQLAPYDQKGLLGLIDGTLVDATEKTAKIEGRLDGQKYVVSLKCRPA